MTALAVARTPTPIVLPPALQLAGPALEGQLIEMLGGDVNPVDLWLAGDRLAAYVDSRLSIIELRDGRSEILGQWLLKDRQDPDQPIHLTGDFVVLPEAERVRVIDVRRPSAIRQMSEFLAPAPVTHIASEGSRIYFCSCGNDETSPDVWIGAVSIEPDGRARTLAQTQLEDVEVLRFGADGGHLGLQLEEERPDGIYRPWRVYALGSLQQSFRLVVERVAEDRFWAIQDDEILIVGPDGLGVYDLLALPALVDRGRWKPAGEYSTIYYAGFSGETLLVGVHVRDSGGNVRGRELHRLAWSGPSDLVVSETWEFADRHLWPGTDGICYARGTSSRHDIACVGKPGVSSEIQPAALSPDGELASMGYCRPSAGTRFAGTDLSLCGRGIIGLEDAGRGRLRALWSTGPAGGFMPAGDQLFLFNGLAQIFRVRVEAGLLQVEDTDLEGLSAAATDGILITINQTSIAPLINTLRVYDALSLEKLGELDLSDTRRRPGPMFDGNMLYIRSSEGGWLEIDLSNPRTPTLKRVLSELPGYGFAVRNGVAYVPQLVFGDAATQRFLLHVHRMDDAFSRVRTIDLTSDVPLLDPVDIYGVELFGDLLLLDRGAGWVSRLDVSNPMQPVRLPPQPFAANNQFSGNRMEISRMGQRLSVSSEGGELSTFPLEPQERPRALQSWSPWAFRAHNGFLEVWDDHLFIGQESRRGDPYLDLWHYSLESPTAPKRLSRIPVHALPHVQLEGDRLTLLAERGQELRVHEIGLTRSPTLIGKWCHVTGLCADYQRNGAYALQAMAARDGIAYAIPDSTDQLLVLDTRTLPVISRIGLWRFEGLRAGRMLLLGDRLIVLREEISPYLIDVSRPEQPRPIGPMNGLPGPISHAAANERMIALAFAKSILLFAIGDSGELSEITRIAATSGLHDLDLSEDRLYAFQDDGLWLYDIHVPRIPVAIGRLPLEAPGKVAVKDDEVLYYMGPRNQVEVINGLEQPRAIAPRAWLPLIEQRR